jgi:hypothetical protein
VEKQAQCRLLVAIIAVQLAFFATSLVERPKLGSDGSTGLLVWQAMERGGHWNCATEPAPADISVDREEFLTWWSPGQYLAIGPLHWMGLTWGAAIASATLVCSLVGIAGYWRLYRLLGFGATTSAWGAGAISLCWHETGNYSQFFGGELPLFAACPWLLACVLWMRPLRWWSALPFSLIYLAGAMVKLSFCVTGLAALAGLCCAEFFAAPTRRQFVSLALKGAAMAALAHALLWAVFLRFGTNPSGMGSHANAWWFVVPVAVVAPALSVISIGSILGRLFLFPGHYIVSAVESLAPVYWVLAVGVALLYRELLRERSLGADYRRFAGGMVAAYMLVLGGLIVAGASISLEDRHFFPVGAVLLPAFVEMARAGASRTWRIVARLGLGVACAYGAVALFVHARQLSGVDNVGRGGFTQHVISREALSLLHDLDDAASSQGIETLVYVPSPEISLELRHVRVMSTDDLFVPAEILRKKVMHGRVPLLVVLTSSALKDGGRDEIIRRGFVDYPPSKWEKRVVGEWIFYFQGTWPKGQSLNPS